MPAALPTMSTLILGALRKLGIVGAGQDAPYPEDTELALNEANGIIGQWNTRRRFAYFSRAQEFTFTTSQQSYSIGTAANAADFVVAAGDRPVKIEYCQLVLTNSTPNVQVPVAVINVDQYVDISVPALASSFPLLIYYKPTLPNGTILPYPAFPTSTSYKLNLTWWNQLETVDIADIATSLQLPPGYQRAFELALAVALYLSFPKKTDLEELKRQMREAVSDIQSLNVAPPKISTTDGVQSRNDSTFDFRSRNWY